MALCGLLETGRRMSAMEGKADIARHGFNQYLVYEYTP
jgi:hypothetical protein